MSYRTRRVLFITPFYMLFEFFLLKYIFLLFGGVEDNYILILTVLIGLNHFMPMLFEKPCYPAGFSFLKKHRQEVI